MIKGVKKKVREIMNSFKLMISFIAFLFLSIYSFSIGYGIHTSYDEGLYTYYSYLSFSHNIGFILVLIIGTIVVLICSCLLYSLVQNEWNEKTSGKFPRIRLIIFCMGIVILLIPQIYPLIFSSGSPYYLFTRISLWLYPTTFFLFCFSFLFAIRGIFAKEDRKNFFIEDFQLYGMFTFLGMFLPLFVFVSSTMEDGGIDGSFILGSFLSSPLYIILIIIIDLLIVIEILTCRSLYKYAQNRWDKEQQGSFPKYRKRLYIFSISILLFSLFYPLILFPFNGYVFSGFIFGSMLSHFFGFAIALKTLLPSDKK